MISAVETWTAARSGLFESLNTEFLHLWQLEMLRKIIAYAREHSRFYSVKLAGIDEHSLSSLADLQRLPFTEPADIACEPLSFLCVPQSAIARVTTIMTSGSMGIKKRIYFTANDLERTVDFFAHGMKTMVKEGQETLIIMSGETESSIGRLLQTGLSRIGVSAQICGFAWDAHRILSAAKTADCIVGIPGEIIYLCRSDKSLRPKSVLLSADFVPECVIRHIAETWHCRVFTHFGMTETGFGCAVQCLAREGHHVRNPDLLIEIIDPETGMHIPPGECGEIVITLLRNQAMPLIRYRTGDMARMVHKPCACGGVLPRLGRVEGRRENDIPLDGGNTLSIHQLDEVMFAIPNVRNFDARLSRENGKNRLFLTIDAAEHLQQHGLAAKLPANLEITIQYAEVNPFLKRAKRRIHTIDGRYCR